MSTLSVTTEMTAPRDKAAETDAAMLRQVSLHLDDRPVLRGIDLNVASGGFTAVLGHNGAGKSTLLRVIGLLLRPTSGMVHLFSQPARPQDTATRSRLGMIAHQPMLYRDLTARENLAFFGRLYGTRDLHARIQQMLEQVALADRADDTVKTFSRGMSQRLAIARAMLHDPDLLLADEPFAGLDIASTEMLEALFTQLSDGGKTIIMANHDVSQSLRLARRVVALNRGMVVLDEAAQATDVDAVRNKVLNS